MTSFKANLVILALWAFAMTTGSINDTDTKQDRVQMEEGNNNMLLSVRGKPHNTSKLLNLDDVMTMEPHALPTIEETFYTDLVNQQSKRKPFAVEIPMGMDDAYNFGDQYMQRLMNGGELPKGYKSRIIKRNTESFNSI